MLCPRRPHLQAATHVVRYLAGTLDWGLDYPTDSELKLTAFCDSDWGTCAFSARSLTGYCVFLGLNDHQEWEMERKALGGEFFALSEGSFRDSFIFI